MFKTMYGGDTYMYNMQQIMQGLKRPFGSSKKQTCCLSTVCGEICTNEKSLKAHTRIRHKEICRSDIVN